MDGRYKGIILLSMVFIILGGMILYQQNVNLDTASKTVVPIDKALQNATETAPAKSDHSIRIFTWDGM